jgi:hypothetical protein
MLDDRTREPATGSPVVIECPATARFIRLAFPLQGKDVTVSVIEWEVRRESATR